LKSKNVSSLFIKVRPLALFQNEQSRLKELKQGYLSYSKVVLLFLHYSNEDTLDTVKLRFLQQLRDLIHLARDRLAEAQGRYKRNNERTVRPYNDGIPKDAWVYVRKEVHAAGTNPKRDDQVEGPFQVALND
jgi:hypothetical protein